MQNPAAPMGFPARPLVGRLALVTGAGSGIGRAVAVTLAQAGMQLLLVGRREEALRSVAQQIDRNTAVVAADLATEAGRDTVASVVSSRLDVLVHCAGLHLRKPLRARPEKG
jgi:short-subunit dehydrogenase